MEGPAAASTIEGARKLCGLEIAEQLDFLQPLVKTFKSLNADRNIKGLMAATVKSIAKNRRWAPNIYILR